MANNYSLYYDAYRNADPEKMKKIAENKVNYGNTDNEEAKKIYNEQNKFLRRSMGITDEQDVPLSTLNDYISMAEREHANKSLIRKLNDSYVPGENIRTAADKVKNFRYNPESDPVYKSYADMYERQGQSAAKSTLNNLNASSGGRNSSYSAAATAQVQAAYNAKAAEMIPTLAQQAYERLLQGYNIEKDADDTAFNRGAQLYQINRNSQSQDISDASSVLDYKMKEEQYNALPNQLQIELEGGRLANEAARITNEGRTIENAINQITLECQQKYGLSNAEAQNLSYILSNQLTQAQIDKTKVSSGYSGGNVSYLPYDVSYNDDYDSGNNVQSYGVSDDGTLAIKNNMTYDKNGNIDSIIVSGYGRITEEEALSLIEQGKIINKNGYLVKA